jgi:hypothetical protein
MRFRHVRPGRVGNPRHQGVTATWHIGDIPRSALAVAERLAQSGDLGPQAAVVHRHVGPDPGYQLTMADHLSAAFNKGDQHVQRAPPMARRAPSRSSNRSVGSNRKGPKQMSSRCRILVICDFNPVRCVRSSILSSAAAELRSIRPMSQPSPRHDGHPGWLAPSAV